MKKKKDNYIEKKEKYRTLLKKNVLLFSFCREER